MNRFKQQRQLCVDLSCEELGEKGKEMDDAKRLLKNGNQCHIIACGSCRRHPRHGCPVHRVDLDRLFILDTPPRKSIRSIPVIYLFVDSADETQIRRACLLSSSSNSLFSSLLSILCSPTAMAVRQRRRLETFTMTSYNSGKPCHEHAPNCLGKPQEHRHAKRSLECYELPAPAWRSSRPYILICTHTRLWLEDNAGEHFHTNIACLCPEQPGCC